MDTISQVVTNNKCSGCSACLNICPVNAISMQRNKEGFLNPIIDEAKCIHCNLCNKICPLLHASVPSKQRILPAVYAGWAKDENIRKKSSSGGVFSLLAESVLLKNGFVCGAQLDENHKLSHVLVSKRSELSKLKGSKYLQSEIGSVFRQIKSLLDQKNWVLFVGVPCQVAGLKNYLRKEYDTLVAVDIVCHGAPSPSVFERYIQEIEHDRDMPITSIHFRDKSTGWKTYSFTLKNNLKNVYKKTFTDDVFYDGFLSNLYLMPICTNCPFSRYPKNSDITLGDYWGIGIYKSKLDDDKGTSIITVNNDRGDQFFNLIKDRMVYEKVSTIEAVKKLKLMSLPYPKHAHRQQFFEDLSLEKTPISQLIKKHLENEMVDANAKNRRVAILNMRLPSNNYGAMLQSYALFKTVCGLGYRAQVIDYVSEHLDHESDKFATYPFYKFRENFIDSTTRRTSDEDLERLNSEFDTFIVGSDQVWNYKYLEAFKTNIGKYFLNFALPSKKLISYAPSFAEDHWDGSIDEIAEVSECLKRFSSISVRETSGVDICKNLFGVHSQCVLDPTLLLEVSEYDKLVESEHFENVQASYVAYFSLDETLEKNTSESNALRDFVNEKKWQLINIRGGVKELFNQHVFMYQSIPGWLHYIKHCEFLITDSYHAALFAILYQKKFVIIERSYAGNERLRSILNILDIPHRIIPTLRDIRNFKAIFEKEIDYINVGIRLSAEKKKSIEFLTRSLNSPSRDILASLETELLASYSHKRELQEKILSGETKNALLMSRIQELELSLTAFLSTKTFVYAQKVKALLNKIGIHRYIKN